MLARLSVLDSFTGGGVIFVFYTVSK